MRQVLLCPVKDDLCPGQAGLDGLAGSVSLTGEGQGAEERDPVSVSIGIAPGKDLRCVIGADCVGAGRSVADLVNAFDRFHEYPSLQRELSALLFPFQELGRCGKQHVTGGVESRFQRILYHADDKPDAHHLHGNVGGDPEQ